MSAVFLPDDDGNFNFLNPDWHSVGSITETVQYKEPDIWIYFSLNTIESNKVKVPNYEKHKKDTHSCLDIGFTHSA